MNNPMPRWWMWLFVITIVFAFAYLAAYPAWATSPGQLGWTQVGEYEAEVTKANAELQPLYARFDSMKTEDIASRPGGHGHRRAFVHEQLCPVSWLGRTR